jgi:hypothetical protein
VNKWERPASLRLQNYQKKLKNYEQTEHFQTYQMYLEAFKQRQHSPEIRPDSKASFTSGTAPPVPQPVHTEQEDPDSDQHMIFDTYGPDSEGQSHDGTSPVRCGMVEVRNYLTTRGINPHMTRVKPYPTEGATTQAVEDFLNGTGALLHLWKREEAMDLIRSVYRPENDGTPLHAIELFAMAGVGSCCDGDISKSFSPTQFLEHFLCLLSSTSAISELRYMRVFCCLAIIRFADNVESARNLIREQSTSLRIYT